MENVEKVIEELEALDRSMSLHQCYACSYEFIDVVNEFGTNIIPKAIALLKEQEPKPIIRKQCKKEHADGSIDYFAEWYCPHCKSLILLGFDNPSIKFCYHCGKPILWKGR